MSTTVFGIHGTMVDTGRRSELGHRIVQVADHEGMWSNPDTLQIGDRVKVTFNELGTGTVRAFFIQEGFIGMEITPDKRPAWHIKQNGDKRPFYTVFGAEVKKL